MLKNLFIVLVLAVPSFSQAQSTEYQYPGKALENLNLEVLEYEGFNRDESGKISNVPIKIMSFEIRGQGLVLYTESELLPCKSPTMAARCNLGRIVKPASFKGILQGEEVLITIPVNNTHLSAVKAWESDIWSVEISSNQKIVLDQSGNSGQQAVFSEFEKTRHDIESEVNEFVTTVAEKNYEASRIAYASVLKYKHSLLPTDKAKVTEALNAIPTDDAPVRSPDFRPYKIEDLNGMSMSEFKKFFANHFMSPMTEKTKDDASTLVYTLFNSNLGPDERLDLLKFPAETRLKVFSDALASGKPLEEFNSYDRDEEIFETALRMIEALDTLESVIYLYEVKTRIKANPKLHQMIYEQLRNSADILRLKRQD